MTPKRLDDRFAEALAARCADVIDGVLDTLPVTSSRNARTLVGIRMRIRMPPASGGPDLDRSINAKKVL